MRDQGSWSLSLGRWGGVHVRLHMFFFLFALATLYLSIHHLSAQQPGQDNHTVWIAVSSLGILLLSVLLHEIAHYVVSKRSGGGGSQIVLGPLGGLADHKPPYEPQAELIVHLAGPLLNLGICLLCVPLLWFTIESPVDILGLLHPLAPKGVTGDGSTWIMLLRMTFWINWVLFLANLLPAFPFDGARALRAALLAARPLMGRRVASYITSWVARFVAFGLFGAAWLVRNQENSSLAHAWFALALLGVFIFFSASQHESRGEEEEEEDDLFGYDFSQGFTSLERSVDVAPRRPGPFTRWLHRRRALKARRQRQIEADEERRVDEILSQLHDQGIDSLSVEDRRLLNRVSARYRGRPSNGG